MRTLKTYKKLHKSESAAEKHTKKINKRGGIVKIFKKSGHTILTYYFPLMIYGFRNKASKKKGKHGTFYTLQPQNRPTNKVKLTFNNPLILEDNEIKPFEGLPLEYLFWKWFPKTDLLRESNKKDMSTGEMIDYLVTNKAREIGYDAIIMGSVEVVDLRE